MNKKQLATLYKVCIKTFNRWLKPHEKEVGKPVGYLYKADQVRKIIELIGIP